MFIRNAQLSLGPPLANQSKDLADLVSNVLPTVQFELSTKEKSFSQRLLSAHQCVGQFLCPFGHTITLLIATERLNILQ
jgi:hypothetical protein